MKKKYLALAYEIDDNQVLEFINKLEYIKKNIVFDDVLVFSNNLTNYNKERINKTYPCIFIDLENSIKAKFKVFDYLSNFKTIVFSNMNIELSNDLINEYKDKIYSVKMHFNYRFVEANFKNLINKYNMFAPSQNTELLIITDKIKKYKRISKWCHKKLIKLDSDMRDSINGILDIMLQKFKISITLINEKTENSIITEKYRIPILKKINQIKDDKKPLVTVLMTLYDRTEYLDKSLQSILKQSYYNLEILIILEYSDKQTEIYKKLSSYKDKRIKIIKNEKRMGLAKSLNLGLNLAKGKYIARMDDDDISVLNRIEKQVEYLENHLDISIVGCFMKFFENSNLVCELPIDNEMLKVKCLYKTPLFHPTVIFRSEDLKSNRFEYKENVYAEDYELWSRIISKLKIANIPEVLYYYRLGLGNKSLQNEISINKSHNNIMRYQLKKYLNLKLTFDELQLLSGRIDVLGNSVNLSEIYKLKIDLWNKILKANRKNKFYSEELIQDEINEIKNYYHIIKNQRES